MSQKKTFSNPAFQAATQNTLVNGFNLAPKVNNFNAIFTPKPLDEKESRVLERLLFDNFSPGKVSEEQVEKDWEDLKNITAEIKAIGKQSLVLLGERIYKGSVILSPYRDGTFTQWIETLQIAKKTAYNMRSYYQLYSELPDSALKERFKQLPQKAAYVLASKDVEIEEKVRVIEDNHDSSADDLIMLIQERFPANAKDGRRKEANKSLLDKIEFGLKKLLKRKDSLSLENLDQISGLRKLIDEILDSKSVL